MGGTKQALESDQQERMRAPSLTAADCILVVCASTVIFASQYILLPCKNQTEH